MPPHNPSSGPSVLTVSLRAFFKTIAVMVGIGFGLVPLLLIIASASNTSGLQTLPSSTKIEVLPGVDGTREALKNNTPIILQVDVSGIIGVNELTSDKVRNILIESREGRLKNNRVKAVLLNIRSPGGTVVDSDAIYHALKTYKERYNVPVYGYVDGLCASGGIYIAMACDKVYASDVSLVGSVGVILRPFLNFTGLMDKIGVESRTLLAGKDKDALNPLRPWREGEDKNLQVVVNNMYDQFVELVAKNRPQIDKGRLVEEYGAQVFSSQEATNNGLIDGTANSIEEVMKALAEQAELSDDYQVIRLKRKAVWVDLLDGQALITGRKITHEFNLGAEFRPELQNQPLYLYSPGFTANP